MFLHLGGDVVVDEKDVIAIIDIESATLAATTRDFLRVVEENGSITSIGEKGKEKSFVITADSVYLSPISSFTLMKRANSKSFTVEVE